MLLENALIEWYKQKRHMGCVAATKWLCERVSNFKSLRVDRYTSKGEIYSHVVATNGKIIIDLAPQTDSCSLYKTRYCFLYKILERNINEK